MMTLKNAQIITRYKYKAQTTWEKKNKERNKVDKGMFTFSGSTLLCTSDLSLTQKMN